jgi:glycosyltransferase involved in cell wall biosynthesis
MAKRLAADWEVHVLAPHTKGARRRETMGGLEVHRFKYAPESLENLCYEGGMLARLRHNPFRFLLLPLFFGAQYLAARRILRRFSITTVHAHWLLPQGLTAVAIKRLSRQPVSILVTSHGADLFALQGGFAQWVKRRVLKDSDRITVVSDAMRSEVMELIGDAGKSEVIPMGTDLQSRFVPGSENRTPGTFVFVGRLVPKKGLEYLLRAFAEVLEEKSDCRLLVAGSGPEENRLKEQARNLGIGGKVEFYGAIENEQLPAVYQRAEIAVFPFVTTPAGDQEGFGLVLVEALGCGCAVVASDMPAVRDILQPGKTGLLVPQKDYSGLAAAMLQLVRDRQTRSRLADAGRDEVMHRFDWQVIAGRYDALLSSLAAGKTTDPS